jgi:hypothetical protein
MNNSMKNHHLIYQPPHFPIPVHHVSHHPHHQRPAQNHLTSNNMTNINNNNNHHLVSRILSPAGNSNEALKFLSKAGQVIIRMRGLPYDCTAQQVVSGEHVKHVLRVSLSLS